MPKNNKPHIAFALFHTGETKGLLGAIKFLKAEGYPLTLLGLGQPAIAVLKAENDLIPHLVAPDATKNNRQGRNEQYETTWTEEDLFQAYSLVKNADLLILGTPANIQHQLAEHISKEKSTTQMIAYLDSFFKAPQNTIFRMYQACDAVWTPCDAITAHVRKLTSHLPAKKPVTTAGHGDIILWQKLFESYDRSALRTIMQLSDSMACELWCGGYNKKEQVALTSFAKTFIQRARNNNQLVFRLAMHPGIAKDPQLKQENYINPLKSVGFTKGQIQMILLDPTKINTSQAIFAADRIISHDSTTAVLTSEAHPTPKSILYFANRECPWPSLPDRGFGIFHSASERITERHLMQEQNFPQTKRQKKAPTNPVETVQRHLRIVQ